MKLFEIILFILVILAVFYLLWRVRLRDEAFLKKKTKDTMSPELREKLEQESAENKRKKEKFESVMKSFGVEE